MTMPRIFNIFLLVLALMAPVSWAHANQIVLLKRAAFGCADKADWKNLTRLVTELPKGTFRPGRSEHMAMHIAFSSLEVGLVSICGTELMPAYTSHDIFAYGYRGS